MLDEVLRVASWIASSMLGQEDAVRVIGPTGAGPSHVNGSETLRKAACPKSTAYVRYEAAHTPILAEPRTLNQGVSVNDSGALGLLRRTFISLK